MRLTTRRTHSSTRGSSRFELTIRERARNARRDELEVVERAAVENRAKLALAIESSVHWYDTLCEAHGVPGERHDAYWINRRRMPPYMSNLITLTQGAEAEAKQLEALRSLIAGGAGCGVKDSFGCLSLSELGLEVLFRANWIFRAQERPVPASGGGLLWRVVSREDELAVWERTWRGVPDNAEARPLDAVFRPSLLQRPDFQLLLGERDGAPVATAALNRSERAVGLSNVFSVAEEPALLFPGCVRAAYAFASDLPVVGYERGAHWVAAEASGFEAIHELAVWVATPVNAS